MPKSSHFRFPYFEEPNTPPFNPTLQPHPQPLPIPHGNREGSLNLAFFIRVPLSILKKWGGARGGV